MAPPDARGARALLATLLLALVLPLPLACARPHPAGAPHAVAVPPQPTPLLWRVSGRHPDDGLFFLLGSVHLGHSGMGDLGPEVADAFAASEELVVEIDITAISDEEIAVITPRYTLLPPGQTLRDVLSPETWELLEVRLAADPELVPVVQNMQPWFLATFLLLRETGAAGLQEQYGVDERFMNQAAGRLPIRGLESVQSQLATMSGMSPRIQDLILFDTLERGDDLQQESRELIDTWMRGDEAELSRLVFSGLEESPELAPYYDALYFARNENMAAQLANLSRDGRRRFVVLGAGHMVGSRGIPELLGRRGFDVEQIGGP